MSDWPSFDELKDLAKSNPEQLEAFRQEQIEKLIDNASDNQKRRLRGLQFQIDSERRRNKTPLSACIAISRRMHQSLNTLNDSLAPFRDGQQGVPQKSSITPKSEAVVLKFAKS